MGPCWKSPTWATARSRSYARQNRCGVLAARQRESAMYCSVIAVFHPCSRVSVRIDSSRSDQEASSSTQMMRKPPPCPPPEGEGGLGPPPEGGGEKAGTIATRNSCRCHGTV